MVDVPADEAESAGARLLELFPQGFEESEAHERVELAVYTDAAGEAAVRKAFEHVSASDVQPGWEDAWRDFHRPVRAAGLWIGPPWVSPPADESVVVVDPGRAFGTGAHPTTRACVELLARVERGSLLDLGCGSGVLSVAAARLGFAPIVALDADPVAVEITRLTAARNQVTVDARCADVLRAKLPATRAAVANIELRVVEDVLRRLDAEVAVTSGYLAGEEPAVVGWETRDLVEIDGWAAHVLARAGALS